MGRKIATIGITVNLENYENLRLEVQGEIGPEGTTEDLIQFLDGLLARLGHGDEATGELVDSYRRRVLAMPGTGTVTAPAAAAAPARKGGEVPAVHPAPAVHQVPAPAARPVPAGSPDAAQHLRETRQMAEAPQGVRQPPEMKPATVRVNPEGKAVKPAARPPARPEAAVPPAPAPGQRKGPTPQPAAEAPKEPAPEDQAPAAGKPIINEGEVPCEVCGASIAKNQEKLSKLLTGKSLCKRCMNP